MRKYRVWGIFTDVPSIIAAPKMTIKGRNLHDMHRDLTLGRRESIRLREIASEIDPGLVATGQEDRVKEIA